MHWSFEQEWILKDFNDKVELDFGKNYTKATFQVNEPDWGIRRLMDSVVEEELLPQLSVSRRAFAVPFLE